MDYTPLIKIARERSSKDPAHDFLHVQRVLKNALLICKEVHADEDVVIPAVLLHELFNYPKGHPQSKYSGDVCAEQADQVLADLSYPADKLDKVLNCIRFHSFSRGVVPDHMEGKVVQDADRLDAIGAIGIARLFATWAEMGTPFYNAADPFADAREWDDKQYGLDHFYIKLFKIADGMHTQVARDMAVARTQFMMDYIQQLRLEIE